MDIIIDNRNYWTKRAASYSQLNREELFSDQKEKWQDYLCERLKSQFPDREPCDIKILEAGTGPGFLSIILADAGYDMTAIDLTPEMLKRAKENAGDLAGSIKFMEMNAEEMTFADGSFDAVVTRNLTWDLPHPDVFYSEICRVMRKDGLLINFDANWYRYLYDEEAMTGFEEDRSNTAKAHISDKNIVEGSDVMEGIARRVPLSNTLRPLWDLNVLSGLGMTAAADESVFERVWSDQEKINFHSTPLFAVSAVKL